jgi:hypothetical protein
MVGAGFGVDTLTVAAGKTFVATNSGKCHDSRIAKDTEMSWISLVTLTANELAVVSVVRVVF